METVVKNKYKVDRVDFAFGIIESNKAGDLITVNTSEIQIILRREKVYLRWKIHRPNHDHSNYPYITLNLPMSGKVVEGKENAEIHLYPNNFMPEFFVHQRETKKINLWDRGEICRYKNGKWITIKENGETV